MSARAWFKELVVAFVVVYALMLAAPAAPVRAATFTLPSLVSYQGTELAEDAYQPVIAGDGDYVVFGGIFDGVQGIWEKDLSTGALSLVAGDQSGSLVAWNAPDAGSPSVSSNGQYVAFTSTADLDPADDPQPAASCSNVYVRDMDVPVGSAGAYTLVSALNGSATGLAYTLNSGGTACAAGGSASADRVAIDAAGDEVAFTVIGESDLTTGSASELTTPVGQVAVRYLDSDATMLVSQTMASEVSGATPEPVPDGAALTTSGEATSVTTSLEGEDVTLPVDASTASISADGNVVAWMGTNIPTQAPAASADAGGANVFAEPLWREISLGAAAPTRRITGGDDPAAPNGEGPFDEFFANGSPDPLNTGPEFGTYDAIQGFGALDVVTPVLDADGQEVAFLANQPLVGEVPVGTPGNPANAGGPADAYVVNMAPGLDRDQALTRLTQVSSYTVEDLAISPDGTKVALTTDDVAFSLSWPVLVTPPLAGVASVGDAQLYEVDLTGGTISLASYGYDGNPANGIVEAPSFTTDGDTLAFASSATNLVYGARNAGTNVFTITENTTPDVPGTVTISPAPSSAPVPAWVLSARAGATKTGKATVSLSVPGAGSVSAVATLASAGTKASRVASATRTVHAAGIVTLTLTPKRRYTAKVRRKSGLYTQVRVSFAASGHKTLTRTMQLTLRDKAKPKKTKRKQKKKKKPAKDTRR